MKIIEPRVELVNAPSYSDLLSLIELADALATNPRVRSPKTAQRSLSETS